MEMNLIEALKERRNGLRVNPGESVGVVREIKESLPDSSLKKIGQGRISFLSKSPLKEGKTVVLNLNEVAGSHFVQRLKDKDPSAMDELVSGYGGKIYGLALKLLKNQHDAEDIVQDTLLKVFEKLDTFRGESALSSWIYRIALNFSYMKIRKGSRNMCTSIEEHMPNFERNGMHLYPIGSWADKADDKLLRKEMKSHIVKNIEELSEKYRTVLVMRDIQGLSASEVAEITEMTVSAVKSRLHRARLFLRKRLSDYYVDREERA